MHELGVMAEVIHMVEDELREQNLTQVDQLVLEIGELSSVIPYYLEQCYPFAVRKTVLEKAVLEIEVIPAIGQCRACHKKFRVLKSSLKCPYCQSHSWELFGGRELLIKEIVAR